ncbi:MAG: transposase [Actinomycetes bacterium]
MHHPPHLYLDHTWYLVTASTLRHEHLLAIDQVKPYFQTKLRELVDEFSVTLRAWVVLNNHYHLLLKSQRGHDLPRFTARLHGATSRFVNQQDAVTGRQVWHNYWDTCIRTERDLWVRFNYVHFNPVKHGYVQQPIDWPFSSYHYYLRTKGVEWLDDCCSRYPVIDLVSGDEFTD